MNRSKLDTLLDKEGVTLEELLSDGDIVSEIKWGNARLTNLYIYQCIHRGFSFNHDIIHEMIDLVIKMPDSNASHERGHK